MAIEKSWRVVPPQLFTADGTTLGVVTVASTAGFKVKQTVVIQSSIVAPIQVQVKRVVSPTSLIVGPLPENIKPVYKQQGNQLLSVREDISAYTVAQGGFIYAAEQPKATLKPDDIIDAVYDQEPTVAIRTTAVDEFGRHIGPNNPLPVALEGSISLGVVEIKGSPSGDLLNVNADGSINVNVVETPVTGQTVKSIYGQILNIASGATTTLVTYTVPIGYTAVLERASVSGENIARFDVLLNNALFDTRRTMFGGDLTSDFDYTTGTANGFVLNSGDVIIIRVLHNRPYTGSFNARLQVLEIT